MIVTGQTGTWIDRWMFHMSGGVWKAGGEESFWPAIRAGAGENSFFLKIGIFHKWPKI